MKTLRYLTYLSAVSCFFMTVKVLTLDSFVDREYFRQQKLLAALCYFLLIILLITRSIIEKKHASDKWTNAS